MKALLATLALALLATVASADSVWTYTGNASSDSAVSDPNPCHCALSGTVVFDAAWNLISFDFTDGTHELASALGATGFFQPWLYNPAPGQQGFNPFVEWTWGIGDGTYGFGSRNYGSQYESSDWANGPSGQYLYVQGNQGTWVDPPNSTPEPATALLVMLSLPLLALRRRNRHANLVRPVTL